MRYRPGRPVRPHPYTPSATVPADHRGNRPCICGRPRRNAVHDQEAVAEVDAAQAEHIRRIGGDR